MKFLLFICAETMLEEMPADEARKHLETARSVSIEDQRRILDRSAPLP